MGYSTGARQLGAVPFEKKLGGGSTKEKATCEKSNHWDEGVKKPMRLNSAGFCDFISEFAQQNLPGTKFLGFNEPPGLL